jgi:hypothetical protein
MLSLTEFSELAAIISAMADVYSIGRETFSVYFERRRSARDFTQKGVVLQGVFSTYSDEEVDAIAKRIKNCRDRFIKEGSGESRVTCFCSVLTDVKDGNGGIIPDPDWKRIYEQLDCANKS